ncbi:hypothetical protein [Flavisericum labens]|uniref:hypothetical protein n=1 Tax=Flavisericum labens TaxID=3377112 RepID=UPI00387B5FD7
MRFSKLRGGAMQLALFIVVVIALMLASFVILVNTHNRFNIQTDFVLETVEKANEGITCALRNEIALNDTLIVDLNDEDYKTLKVYQDYWGLFEKVISSSQIKSNRFRKVALVGSAQQETNRTALYVEDQNKPLVVVGNTKIQGLAHLPKQGVRTGNISGHSYYGNQLIYGATKTSRPELPNLLKKTRIHIQNIQKPLEKVSHEQFLDISKTQNHQNSFLSPVKLVYSKETIHLRGVSLTGHIVVQSTTKIIVDASSKLKDVILLAPVIEIKNNTKGTFQAFATKELMVGKHCDLRYPSALVLIEDETVQEIQTNNSKKETPTMTVEGGTKIKGTMVYLGKTQNYKAQVFIEENATVIGEVFCNRNLELLGTVNGSVFTSSFVANQSGSSYQNHLYNATISIDALPQQYVGLPFENAQKSVVKWLY